MTRRRFRPRLLALGLLTGLTALLAGPACRTATAGYMTASYTFDASNVDAYSGVGQPDGFGTVKVEANDGPSAVNGLNAGQVRFTIDAFALAAYGSLGSNFGIQTFAFNVDDDLTVQSSNVTTQRIRNGVTENLNWTISYERNISEFGTFTIRDSGSGADHRGDPIIVTVSGMGAGATLENFIIKSDINTGSNKIASYFAAHVAGYGGSSAYQENGKVVTSHWMAVTDAPLPPPPSPVPEPSGLVLLLAGAGALAVARFRRQ